MTIRVLHILDHSIPLQSGYAFRTLSILKEQRRLGWITAHMTSSKHYGAVSLEEEVDGLRFYRTLPRANVINRIPIINQLGVIADLKRRLLEVVDKERPNILHAHSPCLNGIAALLVGRELDIPVVYELRASWEDAAVNHGVTWEGSPRYRLSRLLEIWVLRRVDAITTICEGLRGEIIARGIPVEKVTVIPNSVNTNRFRSAGHSDSMLRTELGLDDKLVLGFIGSFYAYEGLDLFLRAVPEIRDGYPDIRILLVGGGPQERSLKQLVEQLGIEQEVGFVGRVPHGEVEAYYDLIDILVYPRHSVRLTELVTPLKPLEAMARGRLLVASDVGGHKELIRDGVTGTLFRAGDSRALTAAVHGLLGDKASWAGRLEAARRYVEQERTWEKSVFRYREIYEGVTASAGNGVR